MKICQTGWCGHPCTCPGSYTNMDRDEATALRDICINHLDKLDAKEQSDKLGELMVGVPAVEVRLVAMKHSGAIHQCDHLLARVILRKEDDCIRTLSGLKSVILDEEGNPTFVQGTDRRTNTRIQYEVLEWKGDVSASVECFGYIEATYIKLVNTTVYLPADME